MLYDSQIKLPETTLFTPEQMLEKSRLETPWRRATASTGARFALGVVALFGVAAAGVGFKSWNAQRVEKNEAHIRSVIQDAGVPENKVTVIRTLMVIGKESCRSAEKSLQGPCQSAREQLESEGYLPKL